RNQAYYDMQWRLLPVRTLDRGRASPVPYPREFDTMRMMAERLANKCGHLHVDFLVSHGRVYVAGDEQIGDYTRALRGWLIIVTATAKRAILSLLLWLAAIEVACALDLCVATTGSDVSNNCQI